MASHFFVLSEGILGLRTNLPKLAWSFGITPPEASANEYEDCRVRLRVEVEKSLATPGATANGQYHYFRGSPGRDAIFYDRRFVLNRRLRLEATGLLSDEPLIRANRTYYRYVSHRFMNLHSLGYVLTDVAGLLLLRRGYAPLHCSAFRTGRATVVVAAPPNTGKTLTSMMACLDHGADFLAEDLAITDGRSVYSVPWTSTFRYYRRIEQSLGCRLRAGLTRVFPPLELLSLQEPKPITDYVDENRILARSDATHVVFLERGDHAVMEVGLDEAARRIQNLNRYEFNYHKAPIVVAAEFFNPALDIAGACSMETIILRRLVASAAECLVVRAPDATQYADMILDAVDRGKTVAPRAA